MRKAKPLPGCFCKGTQVGTRVAGYAHPSTGPSRPRSVPDDPAGYPCDRVPGTYSVPTPEPKPEYVLYTGVYSYDRRAVETQVVGTPIPAGAGVPGYLGAIRGPGVTGSNSRISRRLRVR
eukprot:156417-Rhodomonas_salina.2